VLDMVQSRDLVVEGGVLFLFLGVQGGEVEMGESSRGFTVIYPLLF